MLSAGENELITETEILPLKKLSPGRRGGCVPPLLESVLERWVVQVLLEFRGGLILNFAIDRKMSLHHERQGFEHGKIEGKPIAEAINPAWRDQRSKESAKQWFCVTRA